MKKSILMMAVLLAAIIGSMLLIGCPEATGGSNQGLADGLPCETDAPNMCAGTCTPTGVGNIGICGGGGESNQGLADGLPCDTGNASMCASKVCTATGTGNIGICGNIAAGDIATSPLIGVWETQTPSLSSPRVDFSSALVVFNAAGFATYHRIVGGGERSWGPSSYIYTANRIIVYEGTENNFANVSGSLAYSISGNNLTFSDLKNNISNFITGSIGPGTYTKQ